MAKTETQLFTMDSAFLTMESKALADMVKMMAHAVDTGQPELVDYTLWKLIANAEGCRRQLRSIARNAGDTDLLKRLQGAGVSGYTEAYDGEHTATA